MVSFQESVLDVVRAIPRGKVMTYGAIAATIGRPRAVRAVGTAVGRNPEPFFTRSARGVQLKRSGVPCHRVVRSDGSVGQFAGGVKAKNDLLRREGVVITNGRVAADHFLK